MIDRLSQEYSETKTLERYFTHLPSSFLNRIAPWILQSGLRIYRLDCLEALCNLPLSNAENENNFQIAIVALLDDVADGVLSVNRAVQLLHTNQRKAAGWLAQNGGLDAGEILQELAIHTQLAPNWIAPGMLFDSIYGLIEVEKLRHRITNETRFCALLNSDFYAEGQLKAEPSDVPIRLDLRHKLLYFLKSEPYQCQHCNQLLTSLADFSRHHQSFHPELDRVRKRLKQNCLLPWLRPVITIADKQEEL
jgi:hypothetical protein